MPSGPTMASARAIMPNWSRSSALSRARPVASSAAMKRKCEGWAKGGQCEINRDFMSKTCPTSCGTCKPVGYDKVEMCGQWARSGECKKNPSMILPTCLRTYGSSGARARPAPTPAPLAAAPPPRAPAGQDQGNQQLSRAASDQACSTERPPGPESTNHKPSLSTRRTGEEDG